MIFTWILGYLILVPSYTGEIMVGVPDDGRPIEEQLATLITNKWRAKWGGKKVMEVEVKVYA